MVYLKFYRTERFKFPEQTKMHIPDKNVKAFSKKIAKHFKVSLVTIKLRGFRGSGVAYTGECRIGLSHNPSVLLIVHEIGHLWTHQKLRERKHNKNLMLFIKRACRYAEKKQYWNLAVTQDDLEQHYRKEEKFLVAFSKCPTCDFIMSWNMPNNQRKWYRTHYAINTIHDMTCSKCKNRAKHTIINLKMVTRTERDAQLKEEFSFYSNNKSLMIIPETEYNLAIPETRAIKLYAIPLGCV